MIGVLQRRRLFDAFAARRFRLDSARADTKTESLRTATLWLRRGSKSDGCPPSLLPVALPRRGCHALSRMKGWGPGASIRQMTPEDRRDVGKSILFGLLGVAGIFFFIYILVIVVLGPFLYVYELTGSEGWAVAGLGLGLLVGGGLITLTWYGSRFCRRILRKWAEERKSLRRESGQ